MKNLNIYTFRELIKMYLDERPMPDVAFVTQTEAMKLQSMGKEMNNNSEWITGRRPELKEATNEGDVWVYVVEADEYLIRNYTEIKEGQPWMEIPPPPSYVKPKGFNAELLEAAINVAQWWDSDNRFSPKASGVIDRLRAAIAKAKGEDHG